MQHFKHFLLHCKCQSGSKFQQVPIWKHFGGNTAEDEEDLACGGGGGGEDEPPLMLVIWQNGWNGAGGNGAHRGWSMGTYDKG